MSLTQEGGTVPSGEKKTASPGANRGGRTEEERLREAPGRSSSGKAADLGLGAFPPSPGPPSGSRVSVPLALRWAALPGPPGPPNLCRRSEREESGDLGRKPALLDSQARSPATSLQCQEWMSSVSGPCSRGITPTPTPTQTHQPRGLQLPHPGSVE